MTTLLGWALERVRIEDRPFSLQEFPYMEGPFRASDVEGRIVAMKSAQCGASLWAATESIYDPGVRGLNVIYYFPTDVSVAGLVREKIDPILGADPVLRSLVRALREDRKEVENIHAKRIGAGWARYRGAKARLARQSTPADVVFLDERDDFEEAWIPEIEKRLNASRWKLWREFGTPTVVGGAIHAAYEASDRRVWVIRCEACGAWSDLDWFRDVVAEEAGGRFSLRDLEWSPGEGRDIWVLCPRCGRARDRTARGTWIQTERSRGTAGFSINRLMSPRASVRELWTTFNAATRAGDFSRIGAFYNGDLGLPYTPASSGLSDAILDAATRRFRMVESLPEGTCSAGFDVQGEYLVGRISRILHIDGERVRKAVWIGRTTWDGLEEVLRRYPLRAVVIDGAFDTTKAKEAAARFGGVIWLARYDLQDPAPEVFVPDPGTRWVRVNRTQSMDRSHGELLTGGNILPENARAIPDFYREMKATVRVEETDKKGNKRFVWKKTADADDYRHADNYDWIAAEMIARGWSSGVLPVAASAISSRSEAMSRIRDRATIKGGSAGDEPSRNNLGGLDRRPRSGPVLRGARRGR